jgi:hypothetical protein
METKRSRLDNLLQAPPEGDQLNPCAEAEVRASTACWPAYTHSAGLHTCNKG